MTEQLTKLQKIILEIEELNLPLRDAMRLATAQVDFFVGQHRYLEERNKAFSIASSQAAESAEGSGS